MLDSTLDKKTSALVSSENRRKSRTTYSGMAGRLLKTPAEISNTKIDQASIALIALILSWLVGLIAANCLKETIPWLITLFVISGISISVTYGSKWTNSINLFRIGDNRWSTLPSGLATACSSISIILVGIFAYLHYHPDRTMLANRQVIDIELVSPHDFVDNKSITPSTDKKSPVVIEAKPKIKPTSRPRELEKVAARELQQAKVTTVAVEQRPSKSAPHPVSTKQTPHEQSFVIRQEPAQFLSAVAPAQPKETPHPKPVTHKQNSGISFEEVSPLQMMEVTDSADETGGETAQNGGHSKGGTGSPSLLVSYLNELHKRIKRAWKPPESETRSARIMFRIKKNGRLVSIKLVDSSGAFEADQSAMHAIVTCAPFKPLPEQYQPECLDLLYTFNYRLGEGQLSEINTSQE